MDLLTYHDWMAVMNKNQMAEAECIEHHGCFTGDCPHEKTQDCAKHFYLAGFDACEKIKDAEIQSYKDFIDTIADKLLANKVMTDVEFKMLVVDELAKMKEG